MDEKPRSENLTVTAKGKKVQSGLTFFLNILNGQKRGGMVVQCFRWLGREAKLNAGAVFGKQGGWLYICLTALSEFGASCLRLLTKIGKGRNDILNELRDKLFFLLLFTREAGRYRLSFALRVFLDTEISAQVTDVPWIVLLRELIFPCSVGGVAQSLFPVAL